MAVLEDYFKYTICDKIPAGKNNFVLLSTRSRNLEEKALLTKYTYSIMGAVTAILRGEWKSF